MNTRVWVFFRQLLQERPGFLLVFGMLGPWLSDTETDVFISLIPYKRVLIGISGNGKHVRGVVRTSPRRTVFDVVVSGHKFCDHCNRIGRILGQKICGSEPTHSSSATVQLSIGFHSANLLPTARTQERRYCYQPWRTGWLNGLYQVFRSSYSVPQSLICSSSRAPFSAC